MIINNTEFTLRFLKALEWRQEDKFIGKNGETAITYVAKEHNRVFHKDVWSGSITIYNVD